MVLASTNVTMGKLTFLYESKHGQTRKIGHYIADAARRRGHGVEVVRVAEVDARRLGDADGYIVLAPIYVGRHPPAVRTFVTKYSEMLNARPSLFISVSNSAASEHDDARRAAHERATRFLAETSWRPNLVRTAGGALDYPTYGFFTRLMMKLIARREGYPTDTTRRHELTSWDELDRVTLDFLALVEARSASQRAASVRELDASSRSEVRNVLRG